MNDGAWYRINKLPKFIRSVWCWEFAYLLFHHQASFGSSSVSLATQNLLCNTVIRARDLYIPSISTHQPLIWETVIEKYHEIGFIEIGVRLEKFFKLPETIFRLSSFICVLFRVLTVSCIIELKINICHGAELLQIVFISARAVMGNISGKGVVE